jgi:hypothetical protein
MNVALIESTLRRMSAPDIMRVCALALFIGAAKLQSNMSITSIAFLLLGTLRVDSVDGGFLLSLRGIPMSIFSIWLPRR